VLGRTEPAGSVLGENTVRLRRSGKLVAGVDEIHIEWRTRHAILKWRAMLPGDRPPLSSLIALVNVFSGYVLAGLRVLSAVKSEDCRMLASDGGSAEVVHAIEGQVLLCSSHSEGRPDPRHASRRGRVPV